MKQYIFIFCLHLIPFTALAMNEYDKYWDKLSHTHFFFINNLLKHSSVKVNYLKYRPNNDQKSFPYQIKLAPDQHKKINVLKSDKISIVLITLSSLYQNQSCKIECDTNDNLYKMINIIPCDPGETEVSISLGIENKMTIHSIEDPFTKTPISAQSYHIIKKILKEKAQKKEFIKKNSEKYEQFCLHNNK